MSVTPRRDASNKAQVLVIENTHEFKADDGALLWQVGFVPIDEDNSILSEAEHVTSHPQCFFSRIAGVSSRRQVLLNASLAPGAPLALRRERNNPYDPNAIAVWDRASNGQLGYVPADLAPTLLARVPTGRAFDESFGAMVLSEFRHKSRSGPRAGLRILIGPVGEIELRVCSEDDDDEDQAESASENIAALETHATATQREPRSAGMIESVCPACGASQEAFADLSGFRCAICRRDAWRIKCRRCKRPNTIYGSSTGAGSLQFRCSNCRAKNVIDKSRLRAISTEVRQRESAVVADRRLAAADAKTAKAALLARSQAEAEALNEELQEQLSSLEHALVEGIAESPFSFATMKVHIDMPKFDPGELANGEATPSSDAFMPHEPRGLAALIPGAKSRYQREGRAGEEAYAQAIATHERQERDRIQQLEDAEATHRQSVATVKRQADDENALVEDLERRFAALEPAAVIEYLSHALAAMLLSFPCADPPRIAYSPDSRQLAIQLALPTVEVIPEYRSYRFIKSRAEISATAMPATERKRRYAALIAQIALLMIERSLNCDEQGTIETVVLNGHVATIDKRTGHDVNPCLVTVRTTRDRFAELDLQRVDPIECLKGLTASISRSPAELVPVRPMVDFDMADPRFVTEEDILGMLDTRPNLMELTPKEFESLITNLFEKMGLETRLTQASRDGGVNCVAYDSRPIFGGKVVIQAKRYKNTVGVSAVRDLFGTMQNEGATKGILVTTSGYGQASHEFANGKPLELIDGGNLLYLLKEHTGIDAKIEAPEDWVDPTPPQ